jgi:hypothetical protein
MTEDEREKIIEQVALVCKLVDELPAPEVNDGLALFEAARTLVDEACGIMTTLCQVWSARKPAKPEPKAPSRRAATTEDLMV